MNHKPVSLLFWVVVCAVALIALGSFALSFVALLALATGNGIDPALGWIWPLIVDLSMVIYTAAILVAQLQRRGARLPIALTIFYAAVTITGNLLHAPADPVGWFVAALPPVSLVLGAEALRVMSRHIIEHGAILSSLAQLTGQEYEARRRLDTVSGQISTAQARLEAIKMDIQAGQTGQNAATVTDMNAARQALIETRRGEVLARFRAGEGVGDIAAALDVSARTVKRDIKMLNGKVGVAL
jgi:hypothetical protein